MNPSFAAPAKIMIAPDHQREASLAQRDRALGARVGPDDQQDRRPRSSARATSPGPSLLDPRGAEHGITDQAQDRRVEAGDRRQAGELGVGHPLPGTSSVVSTSPATASGRSLRTLVARERAARLQEPNATRSIAPGHSSGVRDDHGRAR